ncbi:MAG: hypothetical protein HZA94_00965 [Candidatus Vogelbacteria bacterium]|nr:hypothetical protein [Candidatus Vogelbacteria bacterium]
MSKKDIAILSGILLIAVSMGSSVAFAASVAEEEAEGRAIVEQVQAKTLQYSSLNDEQFELVGEYAMGLMMVAGHEAMNQSLVARFGETGERAMHIQMGKQFLGTGYDSTGVSNYGYGMMGSWGGYGSMMGGYGSRYGGYGMMGNWGGSSTGMYWFGLIYQILVTVLLVLAVVWLGRKVFSKK